jgi:hypothetical protein
MVWLPPPSPCITPAEVKAVRVSWLQYLNQYSQQIKCLHLVELDIYAV